jgi:hypothetical protein
MGAKGGPAAEAPAAWRSATVWVHLREATHAGPCPLAASALGSVAPLPNEHARDAAAAGTSLHRPSRQPKIPTKGGFPILTNHSQLFETSKQGPKIPLPNGMRLTPLRRPPHPPPLPRPTLASPACTRRASARCASAGWRGRRQCDRLRQLRGGHRQLPLGGQAPPRPFGAPATSSPLPWGTGPRGAGGHADCCPAPWECQPGGCARGGGRRGSSPQFRRAGH